MMSGDIPILFLVFNRPDVTKKVFESIREAQPPRLYVAADGPRKNRQEESERCNEVRSIVTNVDWDCEVKTLFREKNMGCRKAVSSGIDWYFEQEEMGIILEDDCLPDQSFFRYCDELLHRYAGEEKIMTISGNNFQPKRRTGNSYYFSKFMHCWGWASWRRAWNHYDVKMKDWPSLKKTDLLDNLFTSKRARKYWEAVFDKVYANQIDTWDYQWALSIWKAGGVNILPAVNLVKNIGFTENATHTINTKSAFKNMKINAMSFPLKMPEAIIVNENADEFTQKNLYQTTLFRMLINKIKKELLR